MTGAPFTIFNSNIDVNRNGELTDPSPAGNYSGTAPDAMTNVKNDDDRNAAIGPDYLQLDLRAGWRGRMGRSRTLKSSSTSSTSPTAPTSKIRSAMIA